MLEEPTLSISMKKLNQHTHLGDCYFCTLVDKLDHIVSLALVRSYQEALGECEDLSRILLAHEAGRVMLLSPDTVLLMVGKAAVMTVSGAL